MLAQRAEKAIKICSLNNIQFLFLKLPRCNAKLFMSQSEKKCLKQYRNFFYFETDDLNSCSYFNNTECGELFQKYACIIPEYHE